MTRSRLGRPGSLAPDGTLLWTQVDARQGSGAGIFHEARFPLSVVGYIAYNYGISRAGPDQYGQVGDACPRSTLPRAQTRRVGQVKLGHHQGLAPSPYLTTQLLVQSIRHRMLCRPTLL